MMVADVEGWRSPARGEDQHRFESARTSDDGRGEDEIPAKLPHNVVNDRKPETTAGAYQ